MASENDWPWTSAYVKWDSRIPPVPSIPQIPICGPSCKPKPADLAADVLDAMTRKLRDYDRLSAALTSAQAEAKQNLQRAALAEDERNSYRVAAESDAKEVDDVREVLCAASGEGADDAAARVMRELDEARSWAERLGEAFDCHPGELPRVGKSLSAAMARIAKCVEKVRADDDEIADAVEQLSEGRNKMRAHLDDCDSKLTAMRVALSKAGIPEVEKYPEVPADPYERSLRAGGRVLGGVERIERLQSQRDETRAEVKGLREHLRIMRGASQEACDRLSDELRELKGRLAAVTKDRDTLSMQGKVLCRSIDRLREELSKARADFAQAARSGACAIGQVEGIEELLGLEAGADVIGAVGQLRNECNAAKANYATVARNGSRAVSAMEALRSLLHLPEDGDVVGAVRRHLDAYTRLLEERDRFERMATAATHELDALRAAKPGPDFFESLQRAKDFGEWYKSRLVKTDGPNAAKPTEPFDVSKAKAINGDCAIGMPKPGPMLTPLAVTRSVVKSRFSPTAGPAHEYRGDDWAIDCDHAARITMFAYGDNVRWLEVYVGADSYRSDYAATRKRAAVLADVNAILARYGYVLEQWP